MLSQIFLARIIRSGTDNFLISRKVIDDIYSLQIVIISISDTLQIYQENKIK